MGRKKKNSGFAAVIDGPTAEETEEDVFGEEDGGDKLGEVEDFEPEAPSQSAQKVAAFVTSCRPPGVSEKALNQVPGKLRKFLTK